MGTQKERFVSELEGYEKQLQEFDTFGFGDIEDVHCYCKKAQA